MFLLLFSTFILTVLSATTKDFPFKKASTKILIKFYRAAKPKLYLFHWAFNIASVSVISIVLLKKSTDCSVPFHCKNSITYKMRWQFYRNFVPNLMLIFVWNKCPIIICFFLVFLLYLAHLNSTPFFKFNYSVCF